MAVAKLVVDINANLGGLQSDLDRATGSIQRFARGITDVGTKLTIGITVPLAALSVTVGRAAADFDSLKRGLVAVAGSSRAAEEQLKRLEDIAKLPGLGFREAIQGSVRLQAVGLSVAQTERALRSFGNAVALTGGGKAELDRITVQLGQLAGKGRVLAQDMRLILDAAPATGQALRQAFGTTDTEAIQKLGLTTDQFLTRLFDALDRLPKVTGGVKNSFENLTDSLYRAKVAIGNQLLPAIVPLVQGLTRTLEAVRTLDPNTVRWAIAIGTVAAVLGPMVVVVGQLTAAVTALAAALGVAGLAGTIATGGILLLLGGLSAMFVKNKLDALYAAAAADQYRASLIGLSRGQLLSNLIAEQAKLSDLHVSQNSLRASGGAFEDAFRFRERTKFGERGFWSDFLFGDFTRGAGSMVRQETESMRRLGEEANATGRRVADLKKALDLLNSAPTGGTPPVTPAGGGARDRLAGLLDNLTDRLRELEVLRRFGVASTEMLPDAIQQVDQFGQVFTASIPGQIRLVISLGDELDRLTDGLHKLEAAGRSAPAGLTFGIAELSKQLTQATADLRRLENEWQRSNKLMFGNANVVLPTVQLGNLPAVQKSRLGGSGSLFGPDAPELSSFRKAVSVASESLLQLNRNGFAQLKSVAAGAVSMAAQFTPAGLAAYALSSALEALRPVVEAVLLPVKLFGEIIAIAITPVLRLLFPIIKALAIVLSYVQEAFNRVIGTLLKGIGWFVRGLGKVINFLDPFGNPGNGLVKLGNSLRDSAQSFFDAADEIKKRRKELQDLTFDDALKRTSDSLNRLTESVLNAVQGFKVQKYRFDAANGAVAPASWVPPTQSIRAGDASMGQSFSVGVVNLHAAPGADVSVIWRQLKALIAQEARSKPGMRPLAAQLS